MIFLHRATFLTGQYLHNTGTFNNSISGRCGGPEWVNKETEEGFAPKLQEAGYQVGGALGLSLAATLLCRRCTPAST